MIRVFTLIGKDIDSARSSRLLARSFDFEFRYWTSSASDRELPPTLRQWTHKAAIVSSNVLRSGADVLGSIARKTREMAGTRDRKGDNQSRLINQHDFKPADWRGMRDDSLNGSDDDLADEATCLLTANCDCRTFRFVVNWQRKTQDGTKTTPGYADAVVQPFRSVEWILDSSLDRAQ
jgi:hypothetical protein